MSCLCGILKKRERVIPCCQIATVSKMGFLRLRLQLAYFKWQLLAKTVLASAAILLCCYLPRREWPETEINSTDFYCHQLTKNSVLALTSWEKGRGCCLVQILEQPPWPSGSVGWIVVPYIKRLQVWFPVKAHT